MSRMRRRRFLGLGATLALALGTIAIVLPMALASTVVDAGALRLHLASSGGDYFGYRLPDGTSGGLQTLGASNCEYGYTGDLLASLTPTPGSAKVGLISHGLGVKTSSEGTTGKCGEVNAPGQVLTLEIPSTGPLAGKDFDYAELDIEVHNSAPINMAIFNDGVQVDASPSDGTTLNLVSNCTSSPTSCGPVRNRNWRIRVPSTGSVQFDEIRLWATGSSSKSSIELEGGDAPWLPGGLGASLGTKDSVFHVVTSAEPALAVTKTADPASASAGDPVGFTITVSNTGSGDASDVVATDTLPTDAGLSWSIDNDPGGACSIESGALTCAIGTLNAGSTYTVHITSPTTTDTVADSPIDNSVGVTAANGDATPASASIDVLAPGLGVSKTADATSVSAGNPVGFTIAISNTGPGNALGVVATDTLPTDAGLSWSIDVQDGSACSIESGALTCAVGTLNAGSTYTVHITSPTTTDTVADSPIDNSVSVTTTNDGTAEASGSIEVWQGVLGCPSIGEAFAYQASTSTAPESGPSVGDLARGENFNGADCVAKPYNLTSSTQEGANVISFQEGSVAGQDSAQFQLKIAWDPVLPDTPATSYPTTVAGRTTLIQYGDTDTPHAIEWCEAVVRDVDGNIDLSPGAGATLPEGENWCLVDQTASLLSDGSVAVTEVLYGFGDPKIFR